MKNCKSFKEALSHIKSDSTVFVHGGAATPVQMIKELIANSSHLANIELIHLHTEGEAEYTDQKYRGIFHVTNLFLGKNMRGKIDYDRVDYLPCFLSEIPLLFRNKIKKINVALIQVSPPDVHGFVSLGTSVDISKAAVDCADLVIAHINPSMPRVHGDGFVHVSDIDFAFELEASIFSPAKHSLTKDEMQIGNNVAGLIEDGATLQLGIGTLPDAVCANLFGHKNLGLHTEMWTDGTFELIKKGVINNSQKKFHQGKSTSTFLMGSRELYDYVDDNMSVLNLEANYINSPLVIMRNPKVTAINSAVEIDLTGQVCADSIGHKIISGVGGQMDFIRAAALSNGGKPIFCLPSLSPKGISRIVTTLKPGAGVVTTRAHVQYVVTEFGVANLYGKSLNERAKSLIAISHPSERERLEGEWSIVKSNH